MLNQPIFGLIWLKPQKRNNMKIPPKCVSDVTKLIESDIFKKSCGDNSKAIEEVVKASLAIDDLEAILHIIVVLTSLCTIKEFGILHEAITCTEGLKVAAANTREYLLYNSKD